MGHARRTVQGHSEQCCSDIGCPKNVLIAALIGNRIQKTVKTKTERGVNLLHIARNITLCGGGFVAIKVFHFALKCYILQMALAEQFELQL